MQRKLDKIREQDAEETKNDSWHNAEETLQNPLTLCQGNMLTQCWGNSIKHANTMQRKLDKTVEHYAEETC